jgi:integrase
MKGHIRRRGERSWELKFDLGRDGISGKRKTAFRSFKGTKRQAEAELVQLMAQAAAGKYVDPIKVTVAEFFDRWDRDWATANASPTTLQRYRGLIGNQIKPGLGHFQVQKLRPVHLNEMYATLIRSGLSPRTVGHVHRLLHRALGHAVTWGVAQQNPASAVKPPRVEDTEVEILRAGEIEGLLDKLHGRSLHPIAVFALASGARRGEVLALRWQDVDLATGKVRIERSLEQTKAGGFRFKTTKTKRGRRTITIAPSVIMALRAHRKTQQERWLALGAGRLPENALVFATWNGEPRTPNALSKDWSETMADFGLKITLHALRHTHASMLIASGMDVVTLSRRLGHASPTVTLNVYGHLFSNTDDRAAEITEATFSRLGQTSNES